jgi:hypothetical protein
MKFNSDTHSGRLHSRHKPEEENNVCTIVWMSHSGSKLQALVLFSCTRRRCSTMPKPIADLIGTYLNGSHGPVERVQGVLVALSLSLGFFQLCRIGFDAKLFFWRQFIRPAKKLKNYGSWAAITGATDGIGRAYCDELAKQGVYF